MPVERHHRQRDRHSGNPGYEARLNEALGYVASGEFKSLRQAAKARGVSFQLFLSVFYFTHTFLQVAKSTLSDRATKALYASFDDREAAEAERERITAEKAKQKAADLAAECARIAEDAVSRIFTGRVRSYKKSDLQALACALRVSEDGTIDVLKDRIEEHLTGPEKVQLESNPRFSGLYPKPTQPRRRQARTSHDESLPGVSNNPPLNNEAQLASLNPSIHPPPQNHHHTLNHSPPLSVPL